MLTRQAAAILAVKIDLREHPLLTVPTVPARNDRDYEKPCPGQDVPSDWLPPQLIAAAIVART
ncbi:hypothetical protein GCM10027081_61650 [Cupriavidus yeoncheonensis]